MAVMENILEEVYVRRFFMEENNSYRYLLVVIKNRYPNLRVCSLRECQLRMEQSILQYKVKYRR